MLLLVALYGSYTVAVQVWTPSGKYATTTEPVTGWPRSSSVLPVQTDQSAPQQPSTLSPHCQLHSRGSPSESLLFVASSTTADKLVIGDSSCGIVQLVLYPCSGLTQQTSDIWRHSDSSLTACAMGCWFISDWTVSVMAPACTHSQSVTATISCCGPLVEAPKGSEAISEHVCTPAMNVAARKPSKHLALSAMACMPVKDAKCDLVLAVSAPLLGHSQT